MDGIVVQIETSEIPAHQSEFLWEALQAHGGHFEPVEVEEGCLDIEGGRQARAR